MKPILKWVGGKTQIMEEVFKEFPSVIQNYYEICLGGGSVMFELLLRIKQGKLKLNGKIYAYDVNNTLIHVYKNIQSDYDKLYKILQSIIQDYVSCKQSGEINRNSATHEEALMHKENYYYWIRKSFNALEDSTTLTGSAMFIFLNKTCFRGLYRCGPNGFNVPYGHYKNPEIVNENHLKEVHDIIQNVEFVCADFHDSMTKPRENDFVYIDPPYAPETATSFVGYTADGFSESNHIELFQACHEMSKWKVNWLMSNADVPMVHEYFPNTTFEKREILCKRAINAKNPGKKTKEVLIRKSVVD